MQAVPLGFFLFLAEFAAGVMIVTTLLDWDGEVTAGYLVLNGVFALLAIGAGLWLRLILPAERLLDFPAGQPWVGLEVAAWTGFAVISAAQLFCIRTERRDAGRRTGAAASFAAVGALAVSAATYGGAAGGIASLFAAFTAGALAQGAVWSGMMLGHWYLVTPLLKPRPLLRLNAALAGVIAIQAAIASAGFLGRPLTGADVDWFFWLRVGVGLALPLALAWPIWRTARVRSMMSATGLLYVSLGLVLAGQIIARAYYFVGGVPT